MNRPPAQTSAIARQAVSRKDWLTVQACAREILEQDKGSAEGWFLDGLAHKAMIRKDDAIKAFRKALDLESGRYDAAIEMAVMLAADQRHGEAVQLVDAHEVNLANSPLYLNKAGTVYKNAGINEKAWRLYKRANELQPGIEVVMANLADTSVFLGKIDEARELFTQLLKRQPAHQRNHLSLARLAKATDRSHVDQMKSVLETTRLSPDRNVFMYYALGKELEDLEAWDEAFEYFKKAGDAVASVADYDIEGDLRLVDTVIRTCDTKWLQESPAETPAAKAPIFIVGLPRTGTTVADRIIGSHSQVHSVGETQYMQMVLRRESGIESEQKMTPEMIEACAGLDIGTIGDGYMEMVDYRLGDEPGFVDKLPFNILYLGFIAKAFPDARFVLMKRNPMDSCFSMYKQVFTWAYQFSYTLEGLGRFYETYVRLVDHWRQTLGDRIIEMQYEELVSDQENQTRRLLDGLGLEFEEDCLSFEKNRSATATASSVQVREKAHTRSVDRWKRYESQLQPLRDYLEGAGIAVE